jgi:putative membrane protein
MKYALTAALSTALWMCGGVAMAAPATPADRAFVAKVSQGGMFEVAAGKLATQRASTMDVRDFATAEVHDHMLVGAKLKAISTREGIMIDARPNAEFSAKLAHLSGLSGAAFDSAYLAEMASLHDADGAAFAQESKAGGSDAFRAFGAETHRIVQRHIGAIHAVPAR